MKPSNSLSLFMFPFSNVIPSLCPTRDCISHVSCQSRAGSSILLFRILFTKTGDEFKALEVYSTSSIESMHKSIVLVSKKLLQCALCLIICVSVLVLKAVAGWQKRSSFPVVHPKVGNMNSKLFSSFSVGHALMP